MRRILRFTKYHGCGNDFIVIDEMGRKPMPEKLRSRLATILCDRHFQIGADGVMFLEKARGVDGSMRLFEPAGNEADMCGNGIRCVASYLSEKLGKARVKVLTQDGIKEIAKTRAGYRVNMGKFRSTRKELSEYATDRGKMTDSTLNVSVSVGGRRRPGALVNTGEPHLVFRSKDIDSEDIVGIGEAINQNRRRFPGGVNVNFVQTVDSHDIRVRTYERGVFDETLACGTGATASAGVALKKGWVKQGTVKVHPLGGCISVEVGPDEVAYMTGPATKVFVGEIEVDL
jgi:diaminopimelate epimerase